MSKGGPLRKPVPPVDQEDLNKVFEDAVAKFGNKAFDLNAYNGLKQSQAANAEGLVMCGWYIGRLIELGNGFVLSAQMKAAIEKHGSKFNRSKQGHALWAAEKSGQFVCILNHWRRLKRDSNRKRQSLVKCSAAVKASLEELLSLEPKIKEEACDKATDNSQESNEASSMQQSMGEPVETSKDVAEEAWDKASFKTEDLEQVSLDSRGFPRMLQSPALPIFKKKGKSHRDSLEQAAFAAAEGLAQRSPPKKAKAKCKPKAGASPRPSPASKKRPAAASGGSKKKPSAKSLEDAGGECQRLEKEPSRSEGLEAKPASPKKRLAAASGGECQRLEAKPAKSAKRQAEGLATKPWWSKVKKVLATDQSYLQGWCEKERKWKLLVACSKKQSSEHSNVIVAVEGRAMEANMSKEKLVSLRNEIVGQKKEA